MASLVKILRRGKTLLWTAFSIVIISCAVLVGLGKLLMPYSGQYQPRLEAWLSEEFGRPVVLESFSGDWRAFGPQLTVQGMRLASEDGESGDVLIEEAVIDIKPLNALLPSRALYDFRVVGAGFRLLRRADGSLEISGFGITRERGDEGQSGLHQIASIGELLLENSSLRYDDEILGIHLGVHSIDARLQLHGHRLAAELDARLADEDVGQVYGDLEATLILQLDGAYRPVSARWQVSGQELMLDRLKSRLPPSDYFPSAGKLTTEIWGAWKPEQDHSLRGVIDLRDAKLVTEHLDREIEHINTRFRLSIQDLNEWRLDLSDFRYQDRNPAWSVQSFSLGRQRSEGIGLWLTADAVPVTTPIEIAHDVMNVIGRPWPKYLPGSGIGTVTDFQLILDDRMKMRSAFGAFSDGRVSDWRIWPDISGVDGTLEFGPGHGTISFSGRDIDVTWPRMFSQPLIVDVPNCEINFSWGDGRWQVLMDACRAQNDFVSAFGVMRFRDVKNSDGRPTVDINVRADRLDLASAAPYWPRALLNERVVDWLGQGLKAGDVDFARLLIRGDMDDWPFDHAEGRFETIAEVREGELFYFSGWPSARQVDATVTFAGTGMDVRGRIGSIGEVAVDQVMAHIEDFRTPVLQVGFETNATLPGVVGFVAQSPIQTAIATDLDRFGFEGDAVTTGSLEVPLKQGDAEVTARGTIRVEDARFLADAYGFSLQGISGTLNFDRLGLRGEGLAAEYSGKPSVLDFRAGDPGSAAAESQRRGTPAEEKLHATLRGTFDASDLLGEAILESWPPLARIKGESEWQADFIVAGASDDDNRQLELILQSDLEGIELDLPEPVSKRASERWPVAIHVPLGEESTIATLSLADRAAAAARIDIDLGRADGIAIRFGEAEAGIPVDGRLDITGKTSTLDLDAWVRIVLAEVRSGKDLAGLRLHPGTLHASRLILLDREFPEVDIRFESRDSTLITEFNAEMIDGSINFTHSATGTHDLTAEFERLVLAKPLTSGMKMDLDPAYLPNMHFYAKSFRYANVELGETRIEAYPKGDGFHFETVDAQSSNMNVRASGDWSLRDGAHRSEFDIHMTSESLGDFLRQLEIASPVEGGQTLVEFGVWWDGSPGQFGLARLNGDVDFSVNTGVITNAKPGSGRLLGLLSVQSLPKRLALDFRDVFDSGFAFDEANGTFKMKNGTASTDDVVLTSAAANISLSGSTDLVERRYDQLITVRPGLGNTLPVIGAIAGGPGGAAAGLALQGLLHEQLGEASQVQYTITGAWDEPLIEPVLEPRADGP